MHCSIINIPKINYMKKMDSEEATHVVTHNSLISFISCLIFTRLHINVRI